MLGALRRGAGIACIRLAFMPMERKKLDEDRLSNPLVRDPDSGVDRVLKIFDRDEYGTISPEASFINMFGLCGGIIGAMYGGLMYSRLQNLRFRESNEATLYISKKAAHRELIDSMTLSFGKGAARFGIKYAIFFTSFAGLSTIVSTFRGEPGVLEFTTGGLLTGAFYKFGLGPRGMISGGFFGGFLGTVTGLMIYGLSKITGVTMNDVYQMAYGYFQFKDSNFHKACRKGVEIPDAILEVYYPDGLNSMETTLNDLQDIQNASELKYSKDPILKAKIDPKSVNTSEK